ncbi:hypothetical protein [Kamptonema formosum]|uniref:hypothetical protein n=1 Tax=Kamptonema formosum TaxID=331992 RepID=UPI00034C3DCA|nr:hypothetical protein [Oscillatoria sp. PCC 10802]
MGRYNKKVQDTGTLQEASSGGRSRPAPDLGTQFLRAPSSGVRPLLGRCRCPDWRI